MKIGLIKPKTDLAIKHIQIIMDGKEYYISFHYSLCNGIKDVHVHEKRGKEIDVKVINAYPAISEIIKICAENILIDLEIILSRIIRKMKARK